LARVCTHTCHHATTSELYPILIMIKVTLDLIVWLKHYFHSVLPFFELHLNEHLIFKTSPVNRRCPKRLWRLTGLRDDKQMGIYFTDNHLNWIYLTNNPRSYHKLKQNVQAQQSFMVCVHSWHSNQTITKYTDYTDW